jgi:hypothetical protein
VSQPRTLFLAVRHDRLLHATVPLLLRPIRGADKPIEARDLSPETHETNPTGAYFGTHQGYPQDQAMQESKPRRPLKKLNDRRTRVESLLIRPPRLQRAAGHLKHLGRLTLGEALGFETALPFKQLSAFEALPALVAILIATLLVLAYCSHSYLLFLTPRSWEK